MIKAVILDLDDTLTLTEKACFKLENDTLVAMGRPSMPRSIHLKTWGMPLFEAIAIRSPGISVRDFREHYKPLMEDAVKRGQLDIISEENLDTIDKLLELNLEVVILTSREKDELNHLLGPSHELNNRVSAFYYRNNMRYHKPDPRAFEHIEKEHGWLPKECVYVGDSVSDASAALGAGFKFIVSLESGLRTKQDFKGFAVDGFINVFPELTACIKQLEEQK